MDSEKVKILITFDQQLIAEGLMCLLTNKDNIKRINIASNKDDIYKLIPTFNPDILAMEFTSWMAKYPLLLSGLNSRFPDLKIIIISELISEESLKNIMPYISGYIGKTCSADNWVLAINEIIKEGKYLCPKFLGEFLSCDNKVDSESVLSLREKEILCLWVEYGSNSEVANNLNISISTVRTHLNNIRQKLGKLNHLQLMIYACKHNMLNGNSRPVCPNCKSFCN